MQFLTSIAQSSGMTAEQIQLLDNMYLLATIIFIIPVFGDTLNWKNNYNNTTKSSAVASVIKIISPLIGIGGVLVTIYASGTTKDYLSDTIPVMIVLYAIITVIGLIYDITKIVKKIQNATKRM